MLIPPPQPAMERLVRTALEEDAPWGDITSASLLPSGVSITAALVAREPGVFCGGDIFRTAMLLTDSSLAVTTLVQDGNSFAAETPLATVSGEARSILQAERVALNFAQRLSGIASLTARYVQQTAGTRARIVDTRKTTPGLRVLERYAVRCGGGCNHRFSLSDAALVKDNHLAVLAADRNGDLVERLRAMRSALPHTTHLEVEVDRLDQIDSVLAAGVDTILLDNFSLDDLRAGVAQVNGRALVEASGGVHLDRVRAIAETGVDLISVGALTHGARALDLGLDVKIQDRQ